MPSSRRSELTTAQYGFSILLAFALICMPTLRVTIGPLTLLPEHLSALILLTVMARAHRTGLPVSAPWSKLWFVLMTLWWLFTLIASVVVAVEPSQSLRLMVWVSINLFMAVVVFKLRDVIRARVAQLFGLFTVVLLVAVIAWLAAQVSGVANEFVESDYASDLFRLEGLFDEPNLLAAFIVLSGATMYVFRRELSPWAQWIYILIGSFAVYLTFTRVAWVCWVLVVVAIAASDIRRRTRWGVAVPLLTLGAAALVYFLSGPTYSAGASDPLVGATADRLTTLLDFDQGTGLTRFLTIQSALQDLSQDDSWIGGFGFDGYSQVHDSGVTSYARAYLPTLWVAVFYDGGIFAGVAFASAVALAWLRTARFGTTLFFVSFALLAAATNNILFCFPWALGAFAVGYGSQRAGDIPASVVTQADRSTESAAAWDPAGPVASDTGSRSPSGVPWEVERASVDSAVVQSGATRARLSGGAH